MSEQNFGLGKGITITTGFDLAAALPLDSRTVVHDMEQLRALPADRVYLGLLVYVISENKLYQWKYNLGNDGSLSKEPDWGPIEAEVSTKEIKNLSEVDFAKTPSLQLQKNKSDFFPITHEKYVYDDARVSLPEKYQTKTDNALATTNKTVSGAINEVNTKMTDSIKQFEDQIDETLANLQNQVNDMLEETNNKIAAAETKINNAVAKMETDIANAKTELNKSISDFKDATDKAMAGLEQQIQDSIDERMGQLSNVILTDVQIADLMSKINANISAVDAIK